jgi:hypothetical protein
VDLATTTDSALVCLAEAPPDVVLSTLWIPPLTGLQLQSEIARRCPSALRLMLLSRPELAATLSLARDGETIRFLARPWSGETLTALLWRFLSDQSLLELVGEAPAQGLSVDALCHEACVGRFAPPPCAPEPRADTDSTAIAGGALVRQGGTARLVTELANGRRGIVDIPCSRATERQRIAA